MDLEDEMQNHRGMRLLIILTDSGLQIMSFKWFDVCAHIHVCACVCMCEREKRGACDDTFIRWLLFRSVHRA